jgi:cell division protein ZapA
MAQVDIVVNGHHHTIVCEDGKEEHVRHLAEFVDSRVGDLARQVGQVGEARLIVMAALMIADDLAALQDEFDALKVENRRSKEGAGPANGDGRLLEKLTQRLEDIAARLENA